MTKSSSSLAQLTDPHLLSGSDLAHEFIKMTTTAPMISPAPGFFAVSTIGTKELIVFGAERGAVRHLSFDDDVALFPMEIAQKRNASFSVKGEVVTCNLAGTTATGSSYVEAAMRALLIALPKE